MTVREDILAELTTDPITKIIGELGHGNRIILKAEPTEWVAKIKTTEDMNEKGCEYRFLILILGKRQYGPVIGNNRLEWETPEDMWGYMTTSKPKTQLLTKAKVRKINARKIIEYEKILGWKKACKLYHSKQWMSHLWRPSRRNI